jgi:hypothetical protein
MSRGLTDEPAEPEKEQPEPVEIMQMVYALGLYLEDIEKKIDAIKEQVDKLVE